MVEAPRSSPLRRCVLSILLLSLVSAGSVDGQAPDVRRLTRESQLTEWLVAVKRHHPPGLDSAAVAIASWPEPRLTGIIADIRDFTRFLVRAHARLTRTGQASTFTYDGRSMSTGDVQQLLGLTADEAHRGDVSRLVIRGALLHTDIAAAFDALHSSARSAAPPGAATAILVLDGRQQGAVDRGPHWAVARSLLDLVASDSPHLDLRRRWYAATAAHMQSRSLLADLVSHTAKARQLHPTDADILFYSGAMHETMAAPLIQEAIRGISLPRGITLDVTDARTHLQEARTLFRRAVESNPDHIEARVRFGRVLGILGKHDEAADELRRALGQSDDAVVQYYAALFLGREQATLGRREAARQSFARAAALYPRAQSPRLALSSLAHAAGHPLQATGVLIEALASHRGDDRSRDPWWTYFVARRDEADRLLEDWRRLVVRWNVE